MKNTICLFILSAFAFTAVAQHDHSANTDSKIVSPASASFKDPKLGIAYGQYILLKDALVASSSDDSKKAANDLLATLKEVKGSDAAVQAASKIATAPGLKNND